MSRPPSRLGGCIKSGASFIPLCGEDILRCGRSLSPVSDTFSTTGNNSNLREDSNHLPLTVPKRPLSLDIYVICAIFYHFNRMCQGPLYLYNTILLYFLELSKKASVFQEASPTTPSYLHHSHSSQTTLRTSSFVSQASISLCSLHSLLKQS